MTLFSILSVLFRLFGLAQMADSFLARHEAKVKQQNVANAPTTRDELEKTLQDGKL